MEPDTELSPGAHRLSAEEIKRWRWRMYGGLGVALLPAAIYLAGLIFQVQVNHVVGELLKLAAFVYFAVLLIPSAMALIRTNPQSWRSVWRKRVIRRVLVGFAVTIAALLSLPITGFLAEQTQGAVQIILFAIMLGGIAFVLLASFLGLLDASKNDIERYLTRRRGPSAT